MEALYAAEHNRRGLVTPGLLLDFEEELLEPLDLRVHPFFVRALAEVLRALLEDGLGSVLVLPDALAALHAQVFKVYHLVEHALRATLGRAGVVTLVNI